MMESIEKLREAFEKCTYQIKDELIELDTVWIPKAIAMMMLDDIEAEIERDYMKLPVDADRHSHVKPRTLEDVLRDFAKEMNVSSSDFISVDGEEAYMLAAINETADEIRELMGGDAS